MITNLLILACSATKRPHVRRLPAIERYDGPLWRVLRKWHRAGGQLGPEGLTVWAISGGYGLLDAGVTIPNYNTPMTPAFAAQLRPALARYFPQVKPLGRVRIEVGAAYLPALPLIPWTATFGSGMIGVRQAGLKEWLEDRSTDQRRRAA